MNPKKELLKKRKKFRFSDETCLSTGSTLLNLACTDNPNWGFIKGGYYFLVGDSTSGKTWLSMSCFAESRINPAFKDYELHFDDVEGGAMMNIEHYFGRRVAGDLIPHQSETIQDFYRTMWDLIQARKKFIYVLDSQDALDNQAAKKKFVKNKQAAEVGDKEKGSYGDGKAKYHSENIRWVLSGLRRTGSILIIIGQTRDNPNAFGFADRKTRSGNKSLRFYANLEIWTSVGKTIKKIVRDKPREVGINCIAEVRKNRITGKVGRSRSAVIPIYHGYGIDDTGSVVDFLISENCFKEAKSKDKKKRYKIPDVENFAGSRSEIIKLAEETDTVSVFRDQAAQVWKQIEDECLLVNRRKRYI